MGGEEYDGYGWYMSCPFSLPPIIKFKIVPRHILFPDDAPDRRPPCWPCRPTDRRKRGHQLRLPGHHRVHGGKPAGLPCGGVSANR